MGKKLKQQRQKSEGEQFVEFERRRYVREWDISSAHFAEKGYYEWMADILGIEKGRVLEIGCGSGASTLALAKRHAVVVVEENPACIRRTRQVLEEAGIEVEVHMRGAIRAQGPPHHEIKYAPVDLDSPAAGVAIVEGNIFSDPFLQQYLLASPKFDAVVCWLIGTHSAMRFNKTADLSGINTLAGYRLRVQNSVYEIADRILKPSGALQIVDRGQTSNTESLKQNVMNSHRDQASVTSLVPTFLDEIPYEEPPQEGAAQMALSMPPSGSLESIVGFSLSSIRSFKPGS